MSVRRGVAGRRVALLGLVALSGTVLQVTVASAASPTSPSAAAAAASRPEVVSRADVASAQQAARALGERVLVEAETTESSLTFVEPDGSFTTESVSGPARVLRDEKWAEIDTTLVVDGESVRPKVAKASVRLSKVGNMHIGMLD